MIATHVVRAVRSWSADENSIFGTNMAESSGADQIIKLIALLESFLSANTSHHLNDICVFLSSVYKKFSTLSHILSVFTLL